MDAGARVAGGARLIGVSAAAKHLGVSIKTFRDRIMPYVPVVNVSAPGAERQRRLFSIESLEDTIRQLQRRRAK